MKDDELINKYVPKMTHYCNSDILNAVIRRCDNIEDMKIYESNYWNYRTNIPR